MGYINSSSADASGKSNPIAEIEINGSKWKNDKILITHIETNSSTSTEASTCFVQLSCPNEGFNDKNKFTLDSDFSKIKIGKKLEILMGFNDEKESVFYGFIESFDIEITNTNIVNVTIQGMDAKIWMMTNITTELKKGKKKYSQVVTEICNKYTSKLKGNEVSINGETEFETEIYQQNESDFQFLIKIGKMTGCLFYIYVGKLYFISISALKLENSLTINPDDRILNIRFSNSVWGIPNSVEFVSINNKNYKETISGKVTSSTSVGSGDDATASTTNISSNVNTIKVVDNTLTSAAEAKFLAEAIYDSQNINFVEVNIKIMGCPSAKLGAGAKLKNFGDPIDNKYIITRIKHICDFNMKYYITILTLKCNRTSGLS